MSDGRNESHLAEDVRFEMDKIHRDIIHIPETVHRVCLLLTSRSKLVPAAVVGFSSGL